MATVEEHAMLILAQEGAEVEPVLTAWQDSVAQASVLVLQQEAGESLSAFKRRLHLRLAESAGPSIDRGAFVAKSGFGLPDVLATVALLSSLVAAMVAGGAGRVYLCGHAGDAQANCALEALADAMRDQVRGTGVEVITEVEVVTNGFASTAAHASVPTSLARGTARFDTTSRPPAPDGVGA